MRAHPKEEEVRCEIRTQWICTMKVPDKILRSECKISKTVKDTQ